MFRPSGCRDDRSAEPFESVEDAWFWCCFCDMQKGVGRSHASSSRVPPCETSDIFIVIKRLVEEKSLFQRHLRVLSRYGLKQVSPYMADDSTEEEKNLWKEAMTRLWRPLYNKGIVRDVAPVRPFGLVLAMEYGK